MNKKFLLACLQQSFNIALIVTGAYLIGTVLGTTVGIGIGLIGYAVLPINKG